MPATHVLISRPQPAAAELAKRLEPLGLQAVIIPAFGFRGLDACVQADHEWKQAARRLAIFTSPRAVAFGLSGLDPGLLSGAQLAALGPATRRALEEAGLMVHLGPQGRPDSEGLLAALDPADPPGAALIFAAPGGRKALRNGLEALGWSVREALVYERVPMNPDPAAEQALAEAAGVISIWTSGEAMRQLLGSLAPAARQHVLTGPWLVPSTRLRDMANGLGARQVRVSQGAGNDALAHAVRDMLGGSDA